MCDANSILKEYLFQRFLIPIYCDETCSNGSKSKWIPYDTIEDEDMTEDDINSINTMMDDISKGKDKTKPAQGTCPFAAGMPSFGNLLSSDNIEPTDPKELVQTMMIVMDLLEEKIHGAIELGASGFCPQIKPINMFLVQYPFLNYEEIVSREQGLDALNKIKHLRNNVKLQLKFASNL